MRNEIGQSGVDLEVFLGEIPAAPRGIVIYPQGEGSGKKDCQEAGNHQRVLFERLFTPYDL